MSSSTYDQVHAIAKLGKHPFLAVTVKDHTRAHIEALTQKHTDTYRGKYYIKN